MTAWLDDWRKRLLESLLRHVVGRLTRKGFTMTCEMDEGEVERVVIEPIRAKGETGE